MELTQAQYDALSQGETWVINERPNYDDDIFLPASFISNEQSFEAIMFLFGFEHADLIYRINDEDVIAVYEYNEQVMDFIWINEAYRTITFETEPTGDLLTWLQANAVKQTGGDGYDDNTYYLIVDNMAITNIYKGCRKKRHTKNI